MNWGALEAVGTWATACVALGGIFFVRQQLRQVERTIRGDTHERLTTESFEVLKFLAIQPDSYPYFYEGKKLEENYTHRVFILYAAEMLANYLEHVILQKPNMKAADWAVWKRFLCDSLKLAPTVRQQLLGPRKLWYTAELVLLAEGIERQISTEATSQGT
jgi:hypothetical protein